MFEYCEENAFNSIGEILADLHCDTTHIEELAKEYESDDFLFPDCEETHPHLYKCYDNIVDEIYQRLEDNEMICENFNEEYPTESDELSDAIDDEIEMYLDMIRDDIDG